MTEREKIIEVVKKAFEDCGRMLKEQIPRVLSGEIKKASDGTPPLDEAIADALIEAGIGDTTSLIVENEVLQRDVDNLTRTLEEGTEEFQEVQHRAEVAERALLFLCDKIMSDISVIVFPSTKMQVLNKQELYDYCIEQAEREIEEEKRKDDRSRRV